MLASTNYPRQQNVGIDKISAWTESRRQQNVGSISLLFKPGRVRSSWLLPDLAHVLLLFPGGVDPSMCSHQVCCCRWPPCFYGRTLSSTVTANCTGLPCRKHHKYWRRQNIGACQDFTNFRQTIAVNISAHRLPTKNWWKQKVITITVEYQLTHSRPQK